VPLKLERLEIRELLATVINSLIPLFEGKKQELQYKPLEADYWVMADQHRLEQALVNLLTNANKYTPAEGRINISFEVEEANNWINILIQDSGPGIPAEEQTRIFDRYYRLPVDEQTLQTTGSGLGLPIARWLVELHGGQLRVESEPGIRPGSCFIVGLPLVASC
jgi:signal transduction histidine kinase